jgi:hypothetical protein
MTTAKTKENIEKLVDRIVDSWDIGDLIEYAKENLEEFYSKTGNLEFQEEWDSLEMDDIS